MISIQTSRHNLSHIITSDGEARGVRRQEFTVRVTDASGTTDVFLCFGNAAWRAQVTKGAAHSVNVSPWSRNNVHVSVLAPPGATVIVRRKAG